MNKYSIIIPIHNEFNRIPSLLNGLDDFIKKGHQIIIVDDGSNDGSGEILARIEKISLVILYENMGKGYAINKGLNKVINSKVVIYDGDLELNPLHINNLMLLDKSNNIRCVLGYRYKSLKPVKSNFDWGNFVFTSFFNIILNSNFKDILCCAKAFYINDINGYKLKSIGFDIDVELLTVLSRRFKKGSVTQVLLDYKRRSFDEGKKLQVSDGWVILGRIIRMLRYL